MLLSPIRFGVPALLLLLASCQASAPVENSVGAVVISPLDTLPARLDPRGPQWQLFQLGFAPVFLSGQQLIYLELSSDQSQATGNTGCNAFRAPFELAATDSLRFGPLRTSRVACSAQNTETRFLAALQATRSYKVSADTLRLYGANSRIPLAELLRGQ